MTYLLEPPSPAYLAAQSVLRLIGSQVTILGKDRVPKQGPLLVVSNHRSALDIPLVVAAVQRPVRFACHPYMQTAPILKDLITQLDCIPLDYKGRSASRQFFPKAAAALQAQDALGIFPEGAAPMVHPPAMNQVEPFQRGFAHLALRAAVPNLAILPIAIAPAQETHIPMFPVRLLSWFDPSEPAFHQSGWHPAVMYHRVKVHIGRPYRLTPDLYTQYQGRRARHTVHELTDYCHTEITTLLQPET